MLMINLAYNIIPFWLTHFMIELTLSSITRMNMLLGSLRRRLFLLTITQSYWVLPNKIRKLQTFLSCHANTRGAVLISFRYTRQRYWPEIMDMIFKWIYQNKMDLKFDSSLWIGPCGCDLQCDCLVAVVSRHPKCPGHNWHGRNNAA